LNCSVVDYNSVCNLIFCSVYLDVVCRCVQSHFHVHLSRVVGPIYRKFAVTIEIMHGALPPVRVCLYRSVISRRAGDCEGPDSDGTKPGTRKSFTIFRDIWLTIHCISVFSIFVITHMETSLNIKFHETKYFSTKYLKAGGIKNSVLVKHRPLYISEVKSDAWKK
jgi:hypothetical protein